MPAYTLSTNLVLSAEQRQKLAGIVTQVHCSVTGAPAALVHVFFSHGIPIRRGSTLFVFGNVRKGRTGELNRMLRASLCSTLSRSLGVEERAVDVELFEMNPKWIMEYGEIVPEVGEEEEWMRRTKLTWAKSA
ncbi:tautomerase family protein [Niveispirillum sp. KHB5.9]|uniref:tautomerase family protein n=1 Tax=Niveispirillum sp. KHB5.9 TaxID=3400269 RepID=UPI003A867020